MRAVALYGFDGIKGLQIVDVEKPRPEANEVLIEVKAAGINYAEIELIQGRYPASKPLPYVIGFEAAGVVTEAGPQVANVKAGDRVTAIVSSGGYADYATAKAALAIPIPDGISYAEASTIPVQGISAYTMLKLAAKPQPHETVLVQAAAGGVGLYLVQLLRIAGVRQIIALASSQAKLDLVKSLGAHVTINYSETSWPDQVRAASGGRGADLVLEAAAGEIGEESFKLVAPFGRMVVFGARNIHDTMPPERMQQLIYKNQTLIGFNFPTLVPEQIAEHVPGLLRLIAEHKLKLFATHVFPLDDVHRAFETFSNRQTIGKVVLRPQMTTYQ